MFVRRFVLVIAAFASLCLLATGCTPDVDEASAIEIVAAVETPTAVATTAPLSLPIEPRATESPGAAPLPVEVRAAADAVEATASSGGSLSAPVPAPPTPAAAPTATAVPAIAVPATAVPATAIPAAPTATPAPPPTPVPTATAVPTVAPTPLPSAPSAADYGSRKVSATAFGTLGIAGKASLTLPAAVVELIGFHEAGHPGARAINAATGGVATRVLETRNRGTAATSAADIVVPPGEPLRAPVTGTVVASTTYTLYCDHTDKLVYIEPDGLPGWQVRMFHVQGITPPVGTRVIAGVTVVAEGARQLPFESQVDEFTGAPAWPHVHIEVIDLSIPDTRPPGPGCD